MKLFTSATVKLAGWYLLILMAVSLLFSVIVFQVARSEVDARLHGFALRRGIIAPGTTEPLNTREQMEKATANLLISLVYLNLIVLLGGGVLAHLLARRTLAPIEAAHQAQSRFVANASHQLRTPLAVMKAEAELLLGDTKTTRASLRAGLASTLEEVNRLDELTSMLLELSRTECSLATTTEPFDLPSLLKELIASRQATRRVQLQMPDSLRLTLHQAAVREIIAELIENALKHSPPRQSISLTVTPYKTTVTITVTNSGPGIKPADLPHIFERFYRGEQRSDSYGLGLSLASQLARAIGGQLSAKSQPDHTVFTLQLPRN